jgi:hypothetical protein
MREKSVAVGQRYRKTDGTGLVFEVVEFMGGTNFPHARIVQVDNRTEYRVIALSALMDRQHYELAAEGALPVPKTAPPLRLMHAAGD